MIPREFVQKYLDVKDMLEHGEIDGTKYKAMIIKLCCVYQVDPAILAEYNMDLDPKPIAAPKLKKKS